MLARSDRRTFLAAAASLSLAATGRAFAADEQVAQRARWWLQLDSVVVPGVLWTQPWPPTSCGAPERQEQGLELLERDRA
jgi:hypothetical protein